MSIIRSPGAFAHGRGTDVVVPRRQGRLLLLDALQDCLRSLFGIEPATNKVRIEAIRAKAMDAN